MSDATNAPTMNDESLLSYTQDMRVKLVNELAKDGKLPNDTKEQIVLLSALDSIDKQVINKKKIATAEQGLEADRLVALTVARMAEKFGSHIPFERTIAGSTPRIPEIDEAALPRAILVEGEIDTSISSLTYAELMGDE